MGLDMYLHAELDEDDDALADLQRQDDALAREMLRRCGARA